MAMRSVRNAGCELTSHQKISRKVVKNTGNIIGYFTETELGTLAICMNQSRFQSREVSSRSISNVWMRKTGIFFRDSCWYGRLQMIWWVEDNQYQESSVQHLLKKHVSMQLANVSGHKNWRCKVTGKMLVSNPGLPPEKWFSFQTNKQTKIDENPPQSGPKKSTFEKTARIWRLTPDVRGHEWIIPLDRLCLVGFPGNCLVKGVTMSMVGHLTLFWWKR